MERSNKVETARSASTTLVPSHKGCGKTIILGVEMHGKAISIDSTAILKGRCIMGSLFGGIKAKTDIPILVKRYLNKRLTYLTGRSTFYLVGVMLCFTSPESSASSSLRNLYLPHFFFNLYHCTITIFSLVASLLSIFDSPQFRAVSAMLFTSVQPSFVKGHGQRSAINKVKDSLQSVAAHSFGGDTRYLVEIDPEVGGCAHYRK
ncbi:Alcohol dehydrogenase-like 1 [Platanthera guangdongensis]|uniref:Alcohol dehydrogenase-like 1 n=1 Tax=Platanthera guangdongensis TaxID=2320717 RepID=A0ABR2N3T2_9ASPA